MKKRKNNGYGFKIEKKRLLEFSKIPFKGRLNWLEEANKFLNSIKDPKIRSKWLRFRAAAK